MPFSNSDKGLLPKSYKAAFPFRISAPSFIYPASWMDNIQRLGPYLDEIELLFFDSAHSRDWPSPKEIETMARLAEKHAITYNVHLPTDISPGCLNEPLRQKAVDTLLGMYRLLEPLDPTTSILHLPTDGPLDNDRMRMAWQKRVEKSVMQLMTSGISPDKLSVETLDYPLEWAAPVIEKWDLRVCLDVGHLLIHGYDWREEFEKWSPRINMIHLHGVSGNHDHISLDKLEDPLRSAILDQLASYSGTVSLEVFSFEALQKSLICLEQFFR